MADETSLADAIDVATLTDLLAPYHLLQPWRPDQATQTFPASVLVGLGTMLSEFDGHCSRADEPKETSGELGMSPLGGPQIFFPGGFAPDSQ